MTNVGKQSLRFHKGHGAGNDFVIVEDLQDTLELSADLVARVCDRHFGIGADGLLRVVAQNNTFFMDYRNADGSIAETCGNGIRVFARYLVEAELVSRGNFQIITRAGHVEVTVDSDDVNFDDVAVSMGKVILGENEVAVSTETGSWPGKPAWIPNPHCVSTLRSIDDAGLLISKPKLGSSEMFPLDANFEFIEPISSHHISMRTYERGVGETFACGSGACAAAAVFAEAEKLKAPWTIQVDVLGGTVYVDSDPQGSLTLRGPARIVAQGEVYI